VYRISKFDIRIDEKIDINITIINIRITHVPLSLTSNTKSKFKGQTPFSILPQQSH